MTKIVEEITSKQIKDTPKLSSGDTVVVSVKVKEGKRERIQAFEGVVVAVKNRGISSSFTVRKISFGEGVERPFALYSPIVDSIKVIRSGQVRRAKLYYLRDRTGKSARIAEKIRKNIGIEVETKLENTQEPIQTESQVTEDSKEDSTKKPEKKEDPKKEEVVKTEEGSSEKK